MLYDSRCRIRKALVRRINHWIANRGWRGFLRECWRRAKLIASREPLPRYTHPASTHPFDVQYQVDTSGVVFGEHLETNNPEGYWATGYYGIAPSVLWAALDRLALDWPRFTLVDVGCGKGRALMLASRYPFLGITGVELAPALVRIAVANLSIFRTTWRLPVPTSVICGDATVVPLPAGPLVLFTYHPFAAPVMRKFLAHVAATVMEEPREIYLLYVNPETKSMLDALPWLTLLWEEFFPMTEEDRLGDRFGSEWEHVVAYRN